LAWKSLCINGSYFREAGKGLTGFPQVGDFATDPGRLAFPLRRPGVGLLAGTRRAPNPAAAENVVSMRQTQDFAQDLAMAIGSHFSQFRTV